MSSSQHIPARHVLVESGHHRIGTQDIVSRLVSIASCDSMTHTCQAGCPARLAPGLQVQLGRPAGTPHSLSGRRAAGLPLGLPPAGDKCALVVRGCRKGEELKWQGGPPWGLPPAEVKATKWHTDPEDSISCRTQVGVGIARSSACSSPLLAGPQGSTQIRDGRTSV
jgi:hypothetical protein